MASKSITRDFLTLPLALLIGAGIAALTRGGGAEATTGSGSAARSAPAERPSTTAAAHPAAARRSPEATACAAAWESLKDGRLTAGDREKAQAAILAEWVLHDPASAVEAVYADRHALGFLGDPLRHFDLLPAVAANPEIVEELLKSGRLGLHTHEVRGDWFHHLAKEDPVAILGRLDELSMELEDDVLYSAVEALPSIQEDPALWQGGMDRIASLIARPVKGGFTQVISTALGHGSSLADLNAAFLATADPRMQDLIATAALHTDPDDDPFNDGSELSDEVRSLPEPFRSAVVGSWSKRFPPPPE